MHVIIIMQYITTCISFNHTRTVLESHQLKIWETISCTQVQPRPHMNGTASGFGASGPFSKPWIGMQSVLFLLSLFYQWASRAYSFRGEWYSWNRTSQIMRAHLKPSFASNLLTCHWPEQVTWTKFKHYKPAHKSKDERDGLLNNNPIHHITKEGMKRLRLLPVWGWMLSYRQMGNFRRSLPFFLPNHLSCLGFCLKWQEVIIIRWGPFWNTVNLHLLACILADAWCGSLTHPRLIQSNLGTTLSLVLFYFLFSWRWPRWSWLIAGCVTLFLLYLVIHWTCPWLDDFKIFKFDLREEKAFFPPLAQAYKYKIAPKLNRQVRFYYRLLQ